MRERTGARGLVTVAMLLLASAGVALASTQNGSVAGSGPHGAAHGTVARAPGYLGSGFGISAMSK